MTEPKPKDSAPKGPNQEGPTPKDPKQSKESRRDPICGMKGTIPAHGHWFCSEDCLRKHEEQHGIGKCLTCEMAGKWYKEKLYIVFGVTFALIALSYSIPFLSPWRAAFFDYTRLIWWAVLLGIILGGVIDYFIPSQYISKFLSKQSKVTIVYAVVLGFFMSACSHGILAIAIQLYKKGASGPAVVAFLLASPWANLPITILLFGFFGLPALYFVASAILIAIITGLIFQALLRAGLVESNPNTHLAPEDFSVRDDLRRRLKEHNGSLAHAIKGVSHGSWALSKMVLWWIIFGTILAATARAYVPTHLFMTYLGATLLGLFITLVLATVIEVCSEGSAPLAFEIFSQTGAFGNSFTFLMAGVVTDYTEIGLLWANIGKKTAIWLPIITVPQVLILGYLFNILL